MIHNWKTPGTMTPIGNKIILYLAVVAVVCNLYTCDLFSWDCYDPVIAVKIENQTQDTLEIFINIHRFDTLALSQIVNIKGDPLALAVIHGTFVYIRHSSFTLNPNLQRIKCIFLLYLTYCYQK